MPAPAQHALKLAFTHEQSQASFLPSHRHNKLGLVDSRVSSPSPIASLVLPAGAGFKKTQNPSRTLVNSMRFTLTLFFFVAVFFTTASGAIVPRHKMNLSRMARADIEYRGHGHGYAREVFVDSPEVRDGEEYARGEMMGRKHARDFMRVRVVRGDSDADDFADWVPRGRRHPRDFRRDEYVGHVGRAEFMGRSGNGSIRMHPREFNHGRM